MKHLYAIFSWIVPILLAIIPVFFLPVTRDYYDTNKWLLLIMIFLSMTLAYGIHILTATRHITLAVSSATRALGYITIASLLSLIFVSTNRVEALLAPFGPVTFMALTTLSLLLPNFSDKRIIRRLRWFLYAIASLLGLISVYQFLGMGKVMFPGVEFLADPLWTPSGATVATVSLLSIMLPLLISDTLYHFRTKQESQLAFLISILMTVLAGLAVTLWQLFPKISSNSLQPQAGFLILLQTFSDPTHTFFGIGVENFLAAFSAGRPAWYNLTSLWSTRFNTNINLLFHLTTVYGLLGGLASLYFLKSLFVKHFPLGLRISLIIGCLILLIVPPNLTTLIMLTILPSLSLTHHSYPSLHIPDSRMLRFIIFIFTSMLFVIASYLLIRSYAAEVVFFQSFHAARQNNGTQTYNKQTQAISLNPFVSQYHTIYSHTNINLATSIDTTTDQKDRDLIAQLIQQSIREGKIAVKLNPSSILAWESLARIYQQLARSVQGADAWTVATYKQAIILDPVNPTLHLELGSAYFQAQNYTDAITHYQKAIHLKNNYTNAYYFLGLAYAESGDTRAAIKALTSGLAFAAPNSSDYDMITTQLEKLQKNIVK